MAAERLEEMLRMAQDDDDKLLKDLEAGNDSAVAMGKADPEEAPCGGGNAASPNEDPSYPQNPNARSGVGEPEHLRSSPASPIRANPSSARKRRTVPGEPGRGARNASKRSRKDKGKEPIVTAVPIEEQFFQQTYEQWRVDPFAASLRVICQYREADKVHFERRLAALRAELGVERGKAAAVGAELETEREKVATLEQSLNKKKEALVRAKEILEAAKSNALANGSKVKEAESRAIEAESRVRVSEEKIKELEASVGDSSDRIKLLEQVIEKLNRGKA